MKGGVEIRFTSFFISSHTEGMLGVEMGRNELTLCYTNNTIYRCCEDAFVDRCSLELWMAWGEAILTQWAQLQEIVPSANRTARFLCQP
jgi:hypothetical protein